MDFNNETLPLFDDGEEQESELSNSFISKISNTVTWSTDWTVGTIFNQIERRNIELNPGFQRRDAWNQEKKSRFIESLMLGLPIPQLVLAEEKLSGKFIVVDGKQRLTTINQFFNNELKLKGLNYVDINNKNYQEICGCNPSMTRQLENSPIRSVILRNWGDENLLYSIFYRLNSGSLPLSPQELRSALKPGPIMGFLADYSEKSNGIQLIFKGKRPDPRMKDVELLLRFISFNKFADEYTGDLKLFLNQTCDHYNNHWDETVSEFESVLEEFESIVSICYDIFEVNAFRKYSGKIWENRFSRAVFDIMSYYIPLDLSKSQAIEIKDIFVELCSRNADFLRALSTNTNNLQNVVIRFYVFGKALEKIVSLRNEIPSKFIKIANK